MIVVLFACIFLPWTLSAESANKNVLPRTFGPLYLGMTENEFKKVTGLVSEACEGCSKDEYMADIDIDRYPDIYPKYVYKLEYDQRGAVFHFYKNRIYSMDIPPEVANINDARNKYTAIYGPPTKSEDWASGISCLIWEDKKTIFTITYVRVKGEGYPLNQPVGWIDNIQYEDKSLSMQLEKSKLRDKKKVTRSRK